MVPFSTKKNYNFSCTIPRTYNQKEDFRRIEHFFSEIWEVTEHRWQRILESARVVGHKKAATLLEQTRILHMKRLKWHAFN